jgi:transcriptional regulator GlxA family with amidase domain
MSGVEIVATHGYSEIADSLDTLIVAGGIGVDRASEDRAIIEWVRSTASRARRIASICSGAFVLAAAGLLQDRRVTTHWMYADLLATSYPSVKVDASLIFSRDGNIYTSGGVTAGIDLALALIEEDVGPEIMLAVARTILVFPRRPGGQSQFCTHLAMLDEQHDPFKPLLPPHRKPEFSDLQAWILAHPAGDLTVPALAERMGMSERNFSRLFHHETGETPAQFAERARAEAARYKLEQSLSATETIATECGFGNPERMRRTFQRLYEISPSDYRARFRSTERV